MLSESRRQVKADVRIKVVVAPELMGRKRIGVIRPRPRMLRECIGLVRAQRVARYCAI